MNEIQPSRSWNLRALDRETPAHDDSVLATVSHSGSVTAGRRHGCWSRLPQPLRVFGLLDSLQAIRSRNKAFALL